MRFVLVRLACLALCLTGPTYGSAEVTPEEARKAKEAVLLEPTSDWNIDYGANRCRLLRIFGPKDAPHVLFFLQSAPGSSFAFTVAGPEVRRFAASRKTKIGFVDDVAMQTPDFAGLGDVSSYGPALIISNISLTPEEGEHRRAVVDAELKSKMETDSQYSYAGIDLKEAQRSRNVTLKMGKRVLSFKTGVMKAPIKALNACTASLLKSWGFDPNAPLPTRSAQLINLDELAKNVSRKYPKEALRKRQSAFFKVFVIIEADGSVSSCKLQKTTAADALDSPACEIFKAEAKFEPALGIDGQPMRSWYSSTITYRIN